MIIALGCDHAGCPLKLQLHAWLEKNGHTVVNLGVDTDSVPADYPDYARAVAEAVAAGKAERGLVVCGSGVGATIAVNKVPGIRGCMCHDTFSARQGVEDDDMNVLCLGGRIIGSELAYEVLKAFLGAKFSGLDRHKRRKDKVTAIERTYSKEAVK
ncbi:MAG: RpiB/LacA/LacB family sugar-phosphate isomerase [Elusimicrobiota bacterium]|nr:MAG: RpiB/LacA/LacB family sugar-phosphate isomerase [Elusimicrobiota bacterium]